MKATPKKPKVSKAPGRVAQAKPPSEPREVAVRTFDLGPLRVLPAVAFFLTYYLCLAKWVDVQLIYHGGGQVQDFPSFYWGWEFARAFQTHPGGFVEYVSSFLAQSLYSSAFGALVLTLQTAFVYGGINGCLRAFGAKRLSWVGFIAPLLYLAIYSKYRHYSAPLTSFALGVGALWLWLRLSSWKPGWRIGNTLVLTACLYAVAPSALLVFLPVALLFEFLTSTTRLNLLLWPGLVSLVPWIEGSVVFGFAPGEAYAKLLPMPWDPIVLKLAGFWIVIALYVLPSLFCIAALLWRLFRTWKRPKGEVLSNAADSTGISQHQLIETSSHELVGARSLAFLTAQIVGLAIVPLAVVLLVLNPRVRASLKVDYLAWHGRWLEVLTAAKANPRNTLVACAVAQASYHTGALTSQLPTLPSPSDLLLFGDKQQAHWKRSDLYFDLGYLNMALHHLTESMEFYGERPALLQRLALVNLALTNISTARVYLGTLTRAPFQGQWARNYVERLEKDPSLAGDDEVSRLRRLMVTRDSVIVLSPDEELLMLLGANRQNRMAFEYLMTYYLLTKNLQAFVRNISRVKDFSGFEISPMWDEALLLAGLESGRPVAVPGHVVNSEARARVEAVARVVQKNGENAELSRRELTADYAHTYSFYWFFHL